MAGMGVFGGPELSEHRLLPNRWRVPPGRIAKRPAKLPPALGVRRLGPVNAIGTGPVAVSGIQAVVRSAATGWWPVPAVRGRLSAGHGNPKGRA
jgi:hypothetical protein